MPELIFVVLYETKAEETIVKLSEKNEIISKRLLNSEIIIAVLIVMAYAFYAVRIKTETGYYQCKECAATFAPTYRQVLMVLHMGWTRRMN